MIGVNTFCLRKEMGTNAPKLIRELHEMGVDAVEPFVYSEAALAGVKAETEKYGMSIPSIHLVFYGMDPTVENLVPYLKKLHGQYGVEAFVISGHIRNASDAQQWGPILKTLASELKEDGIKIVYHNHDSEMHAIDVDGERILVQDYFFRLAGDDVLLQLDIGWAGLVQDEIEIAKHYLDRIYSLHLKDFRPGYRGKYSCHDIPQESFCPIGCGEIKNRDYFNLRKEMPNFCGAVILDQDNSTADLMEDLRVGIQNIRSWL